MPETMKEVLLAGPNLYESDVGYALMVAFFVFFGYGLLISLYRSLHFKRELRGAWLLSLLAFGVGFYFYLQRKDSWYLRLKNDLKVQELLEQEKHETLKAGETDDHAGRQTSEEEG